MHDFKSGIQVGVMTAAWPNKRVCNCCCRISTQKKFWCCHRGTPWDVDWSLFFLVSARTNKRHHHHADNKIIITLII